MKRKLLVILYAIQLYSADAAMMSSFGNGQFSNNYSNGYPNNYSNMFNSQNNQQSNYSNGYNSMNNNSMMYMNMQSYNTNGTRTCEQATSDYEQNGYLDLSNTIDFTMNGTNRLTQFYEQVKKAGITTVYIDLCNTNVMPSVVKEWNDKFQQDGITVLWNISNNSSINDNIFQLLSTATNITGLNVSNTQVTDFGIYNFISGQSSNDTIKFINVTGTSISPMIAMQQQKIKIIYDNENSTGTNQGNYNMMNFGMNSNGLNYNMINNNMGNNSSNNSMTNTGMMGYNMNSSNMANSNFNNMMNNSSSNMSNNFMNNNYNNMMSSGSYNGMMNNTQYNNMANSSASYGTQQNGITNTTLSSMFY